MSRSGFTGLMEIVMVLSKSMISAGSGLARAS